MSDTEQREDAEWARLRRGLHKLLADGLRPFVERELKRVHQDAWLARIQPPPNDPGRLPPRRSTGSMDLQALLSVMKREWEGVFSKRLTKQERNLVVELIDHRNAWLAHPTPDHPLESHYVYRALTSAWLLLVKIAAPEAEKVRQLMDQQLADIQRRPVEKSQKPSQPEAVTEPLEPEPTVVLTHEADINVVESAAGETDLDGQRGIETRVSFSVAGVPDGSPLEIRLTLDGRDSPVVLTSRFDSRRPVWRNAVLFLPFQGLAGGPHDVGYRIRVYVQEHGRKSPPVADHVGHPCRFFVRSVRILDVEFSTLERKGQRGTRVRVHFEVKGHAGTPLQLEAAFSRADGTPVARSSGSRGQVEPVRDTKTITPSGHALKVHHLDLALDPAVAAESLSHGHHELRCRIEIFITGADGAREALDSVEQPFDLDIEPGRAVAYFTPPALTEQLTREAVVVVANFDVLNMARCLAAVDLDVFDESGNPLSRSDGLPAPDGGVRSRCNLQIVTDQARFRDVRLSIPYSRLKLRPGPHTLRYRVSVRNLSPLKDLVWENRQLDVVVPPPNAAGTLSVLHEKLEQLDAGGRQGLTVVAALTLHNLSGWTVDVVGLLCDDAGEPAVEAANPTLVFNRLTPSSDAFSIAALTCFVPYDALPLTSDRRTVTYRLALRAPHPLGQLVSTPPRTIVVPPRGQVQSATIDALDARFGETSDGEPGVAIDVRLTPLVSGVAPVSVGVFARPMLGASAPALAMSDEVARGAVMATVGGRPQSMTVFVAYRALRLDPGDHVVEYAVSVDDLEAVGAATDGAAGSPRARREVARSALRHCRIRVFAGEGSGACDREDSTQTRRYEGSPVSVSIEHETSVEIVEGTEKGRRTDLAVVARGLKGRQIHIAGNFFENGQPCPHAGNEPAFRSADGRVCTSLTLDVLDDGAVFKGPTAIRLFVPYSAFGFGIGRRRLAPKFAAFIGLPEGWRPVAVVDSPEWSLSSRPTDATADVSDVRHSFEQRVEGQTGVLIRAVCRVSNARGWPCFAVALFMRQDGSILPNVDNDYGILWDGGASQVASRLTPLAATGEAEDIDLFVPLSQLHLPAAGPHVVQYVVGVYLEAHAENRIDTQLGRSESARIELMV
jgi:hypothetical protein